LPATFLRARRDSAPRVRYFFAVVSLTLGLLPAHSLAQSIPPTVPLGGGGRGIPTSAEDPGVSWLVPGGSVALLVAGGVAAAVSWKVENADEAARSLDRSWVDGLADFGDRYGDGATLGAATLGLILAAQIGGSPRLSAASADMTRSLLTSGALVWGIKVSVNRTRPSGGDYSFPSGHTAAAFSVAPVLTRHFGWKAGVPAYLLAATTAAGRMEERRHYLSDVVFGAAVGMAAGYWAVSPGKPMRFLDHLLIDTDRVGVAIDF
jgi:hypothetical protein